MRARGRHLGNVPGVAGASGGSPYCAVVAEIIDVVEHEVLTYEGFGGAVRDLAQAIHDSGYEPDWLVAIARGGLMIGARSRTRSGTRTSRRSTSSSTRASTNGSTFRSSCRPC